MTPGPDIECSPHNHKHITINESTIPKKTHKSQMDMESIS